MFTNVEVKLSPECTGTLVMLWHVGGMWVAADHKAVQQWKHHSLMPIYGFREM